MHDSDKQFYGNGLPSLKVGLSKADVMHDSDKQFYGNGLPYLKVGLSKADVHARLG